MIKSALKTGEAIYAINIRMLVTRSTFAATLTDHFYGNSAPFPIKLSKKAALDILKRGLFFAGIHGEYTDENVGSEYMDEYNAVYQKANEWVCKNHPYLLGTLN